MITEAEIGAMWPQAKDVNSHQELEEAGNGFSSGEPPQGPWSCPHIDFSPVILVLNVWAPEL